MKIFKYLLSIVAVTVILAACPTAPGDSANGDDTEETDDTEDNDGNGDSDGDEPLGEPDVYVAGYYNNGTRDVAFYWKNGTQQPDLDSGAYDARATDVFVDGTDVYIAGYYNDTSGTPKNVACYWKNGTKTDLPADTGRSRANAVFVDGTDVYIAGYYNDGTGDIACYWKNGAGPTGFSGGYDNSTNLAIDAANSVFLADGTVYIAGHYHNGTTAAATYWVDGTQQPDLFDSDKVSQALDVFVGSDGNVYVSGFYFNETESVLASCYWVNDAAGQEPLYTAATSYAYGIDVESGSVYAAGYFDDSGSDTACYWKDGTKTDLVAGAAYGIDAYGSDLYIAGYYDDGQKKIAVLWENDSLVPLYNSGTAGVGAEALAVTAVPAP
jgi:hypothetical protein